MPAGKGEARHEAESHDWNWAERAYNARPTPQARASRACYGEHHPTAWRGVCSICTHRDRPHSWLCPQPFFNPIHQLLTADFWIGIVDHRLQPFFAFEYGRFPIRALRSKMSFKSNKDGSG